MEKRRLRIGLKNILEQQSVIETAKKFGPQILASLDDQPRLQYLQVMGNCSISTNFT